MTDVAALILSFLLAAYIVVLVPPALRFVFRKKNKHENSSPKTFISVIIPARNEEKNIAACLDSLSKLNYPAALREIIIVDDHSADRTRPIAEDCARQFDNLKLICNDANSKGKKSAITAGIQQAKGELIVTTDADCLVPPQWLNEIAAVYEKENPLLIAGPVHYVNGKFFRNLLGIEQVILQMISGGAMLSGNPVMCSGANLAYRKDFFISSGGYANDHHASGDDMMLMLKAYRAKGRLCFLTRESAIVRTQAVSTFREAVQQRSRWLSKFSAYRSLNISIMGIAVLLGNLLLPGLLIAVLLNGALAGLFLWTLAGKIFVDLLLLSLAVPFFREPRLLWLALPGEIIYPALSLVSAAAKLSGRYRWKDREWKT